MVHSARKPSKDGGLHGYLQESGHHQQVHLLCFRFLIKTNKSDFLEYLLPFIRYSHTIYHLVANYLSIRLNVCCVLLWQQNNYVSGLVCTMWLHTSSYLSYMLTSLGSDSIWTKTLVRLSPLQSLKLGNFMGRNSGSIFATVCPCHVLPSVECSDARPCLHC